MPHITNICNTTFSLYHIATICNTTFSCSLPQSDPKYTVPLIVKVTQSRTIVYHALVSNIRLHTQLYCTKGSCTTHTMQNKSAPWVAHAPAHAKARCTMPLPTLVYRYGVPCHCPVATLLSSIKTKGYHGLHQHMPKHGVPCYCPTLICWNFSSVISCRK